MTRTRRKWPLVVLGTTAAALVLFGSVAIAGGESVDKAVDTTAVPASTSQVTEVARPTTTAVPDIDPIPAAQAPIEPDRDTVTAGTVGVTDTDGELEPLRVRIPGIEVDAPIIDLGVNPDGTLEVPSDFDDTGWYTGRSVPGEFGPSVVVGHVDSTAGPAVFYRLRDLVVGDRVQIDRSDGTVAWFEVTETVLVDKDAFPTEEVYGATDAPELRLITCGGSFDSDERSYRGNLIVYAKHVGNHKPDRTSGVD